MARIRGGFCPGCGFHVDHGGWEIEVSGSDAGEVHEVSRSLFEKIAEQKKPLARRNPWLSGSFYLAAFAIVATLFLVVARTVTFSVLPIVAIVALLGVSLIGAFQLRQDESLSEKNFLALMALTFKQIPLLGSRKTTTQRGNPGS
jgi:hypothetical protein